MNTLKLISLVFLSFSFFVSCTRNSADTVNVKIQMPTRDQLETQSWINNRLLNLSSPTQNTLLVTTSEIDSEVLPEWGLVTPSNISEITCFSVFVGGPEIELNKSTCYHSQISADAEFKKFFNYGLRKGLINLGQSTDVIVTSGPSRSFYLAGIKSADGRCDDFSALQNQDDESNFSTPVLLGMQTVDLEPGEKTLEISIKSSFSIDDEIAYCDDDLDESDPATETPPGDGTTPGTDPTPTDPFSISATQMQDLSSRTVGASYSLTVTIINNSPEALESGIAVPNPNAPFVFMSSGCGIILNSGDSCVLTYSFTPLSALPYSVTLPASVSYDGVTKNFDVTLAGSGVMNSTLSVTELYTAFESWNEYVTVASPYSSPTACAGTETSYDLCIHAGEQKKAPLGPEYSSCSNLTAYDSLGAFKWTCAINDLGKAEMRSVGLMPGKGLKDLIDFSTGTWRNLYLTVQLSGVSIFQSSPSVWWLNSLIDLSGVAAGTNLSASGNIYYLNSNLTRSSGWVINGDQIAVVFDSGVKLTISSPASLCGTTGESTSATLNGGLCMGAQKFNWIEVNIDLNGISGNGVYLVDSKFNSILYTKIANQTGSHSGIKLYNSSCNRISDSQVLNSQYGLVLTGGNADNNLISRLDIDKTYSQGSAGAGISLDFGADNNKFVGVNVTRVYGTYGAIRLSDAAFNRFIDFTISNSDKGIYIQQGHDNYFTSGTIAHITNASYGEGISIEGISTYQNYFSFLTIVGARSNAIYAASNVDNIIFHQILAYNNSKGIELASIMDVYLSHIVSINSSTYPISFNSGSTPNVYGVVKYRKTGTSDPSVCDDNSSTATCGIWGGVPVIGNSVSPFVGQVNDFTQGSIGLTSVSSGSVTNWTKFDNRYRFWGRAMTITGLIETLYSGLLGVESVQIFDLGLSVTDTEILNRSRDGSSPNGTMSGVCSSAVDAGNSDNVHPSTGFNNPFLLNAKEKMDAFASGDKDGLCESGETCIYAPNFGAYQGHGNLVGPCAFTSGNGVSGVSIFYYDSNGF